MFSTFGALRKEAANKQTPNWLVLVSFGLFIWFGFVWLLRLFVCLLAGLLACLFYCLFVCLFVCLFLRLFMHYYDSSAKGNVV